MTFPNIFSTSFPPNSFQKNKNAALPHPAPFNPSLLPEDNLHVPNQLPYQSSSQIPIPQFGFDFSLTNFEGDYWGNSSSPKMYKWGSTNYWGNNNNNQTSKEEQEQNIQSEKWNRENAEMAKTLPPVEKDFSSELDNFVKAHTHSKIVPD